MVFITVFIYLFIMLAFMYLKDETMETILELFQRERERKWGVQIYFLLTGQLGPIPDWQIWCRDWIMKSLWDTFACLKNDRKWRIPCQNEIKEPFGPIRSWHDMSQFATCLQINYKKLFNSSLFPTASEILKFNQMLSKF